MVRVAAAGRLQALAVPGRVAAGAEEVGSHVVVDAVHVEAEAVEELHRLGPDQPGAAGDEDLHVRTAGTRTGRTWLGTLPTRSPVPPPGVPVRAHLQWPRDRGARRARWASAERRRGPAHLPSRHGGLRCAASRPCSPPAGHDRVVVVDNGQSLDRAAVDRVVGAGGSAATVDLVTTEENLGFAGGMNAGITHALERGADAVAVLNDDTVVEPGWLDALASHLEDERVGAVQPKLLLDRPGGGATREPVIASVGMRVRDDGAGIDLGYGEVDRGQYAQAVGIDLFTGGAVLLTARFLADVGGFDERYFLYYEDIDLARRGRERGWRYLVEPGAVVHHAMSSTASTLPGLHRYWQERNRLWWLFRHGSPYQVARGLLLSLLRLAKHPIRSQATAIRDGVAGSALVLARAAPAAGGHAAARGGALDRALSQRSDRPRASPRRYWAGNVWDRSCSSATH